MDIRALIEFFLVAISGTFVIINPLTVTFLFLTVAANETEKSKRFLAKRAVMLATSLLFAFALLGSLIFQFLGITLGAFMIAGGLILFTMSMRMIGQSQTPSESYTLDPDNLQSYYNLAIMPLAIPFISGPGSITTVMIISSKATTFPHMVALLLAIFITTISCYFSMVKSEYITRLLGETGKEVIVRVFGLILAVLAVQFIIDGISQSIYKDFDWLFEALKKELN